MTTNLPDAPSLKLTGEELVEFFERVRALKAACGPNKNGQATAVISAAIAEGIDTKPQIVGVLTKLGFNHRHANIMLKGGTKEMQHDVPWAFDRATGRYILID